MKKVKQHKSREEIADTIMVVISAIVVALFISPGAIIGSMRILIGM